MEFRITVHLHHFFNDFRSSSRLFITKKIKTIQNLQEHISEIFQINTDFYLVANNVYLPNAENVRILKEDETISAIPYTTQIQQSVAPSTEKAKLSNHEVADTSNIKPSEVQEYENKERSKRKRKFVQECCSNTSALMSTTLEKKQKKKNVKSEDINGTEPENLLEAKKKKKIIDEQKEPKKATKDHDYFAAKSKTSVVQNGQDSEPSDDSDDDKAASSKNTSSKNFNPYSELCRNKKKPVELMLISSTPKLVKPIKVYDKLQALPHAESLNNSITVVDSNQNNITVKHTHSGEQNENNANTKCSEIKIIGPAVIMKNEDTLMQTENKDVESLEENKAVAEQQSVSNFSAISVVTPSDTTEHLSGNESVNSLNLKTKRKRKRVRCRKKKTVNGIASVEIPTMPVNIKPLVTQAAPSLHIRFDDVQNNEAAEVVGEVNSEIASTEVAVAETNSVKIVNDAGSFDINYEKLCTEEIVKFPIMKNVPPKEGDVIAFKMYVISKSYTPEISNFIIARVLKCSPENENVSLKLLVGGDQCEIPEGKLYMESCDSGDEDKTDEMDFTWAKLIEPRLLFP